MWVKVDVDILNHPKMQDAATMLGGPAAKARCFTTFLALLSACKKAESRGVIDRKMLKALQADKLETDPATVVSSLAAARLVDHHAGVLTIHDYADWQTIRDHNGRFSPPTGDTPTDFHRAQGTFPQGAARQKVTESDSRSFPQKDGMTESDRARHSVTAQRSDQRSDPKYINTLDPLPKIDVSRFPNSKRLCYAICHAELDRHPDAMDAELMAQMKQATCKLRRPYKGHELAAFITAVRTIRAHRAAKKTG